MPRSIYQRLSHSLLVRYRNRNAEEFSAPPGLKMKSMNRTAA
jgi:hypothetical protein